MCIIISDLSHLTCHLVVCSQKHFVSTKLLILHHRCLIALTSLASCPKQALGLLEILLYKQSIQHYKMILKVINLVLRLSGIIFLVAIFFHLNIVDLCWMCYLVAEYSLVFWPESWDLLFVWTGKYQFKCYEGSPSTPNICHVVVKFPKIGCTLPWIHC